MSSPKELAQMAQQLSELMSQFAQALGGVEAPATKKRAKKPIAKEPVRVEKKSVRPKLSYNNDPSSPDYDPEPPFAIEKVPPRDERLSQGKLVIAKGSIFICRGCNQPAVKATRDIYNSEEKGQGLELSALEILDKQYDWSDNVTVDKKGGVCITCPLCGKLALWLIGKPPSSNTDTTF